MFKASTRITVVNKIPDGRNEPQPKHSKARTERQDNVSSVIIFNVRIVKVKHLDIFIAHKANH